ncbi:MAG: sigma-54-dependent Fis family transcriptional regulator [Acidobacteria bacterium]|nr:sigma-54-dependent Fis family transcriptional regulator [Acidobacteriota bacterium]
MSSTTSFELIGHSAALRELQQEAALAARSTAKVLITGESGVGKELIARLVHHYSPAASEPLVVVNCAGIPDTLLESELFGHARGSFTGAYRDKPGRLQMADRGMVFLDEIGEMSARMQSLLLRFLETGELQPIGGVASTATVNARVVCATNRDLLQRVREGEFRQDLYYRLNVVHLVVPPLRERPEDVVDLLEHYLQSYGKRYQRFVRLSPAALGKLVAYDWPGNVRELKNVVERIIVRSRTATIEITDLPRDVMFPHAAPREGGGADGPGDAARKVNAILQRMLSERESFWSAVHAPFLKHDLTRDDVRAVVHRGLEETRGNYRMLIELFNMPPRDYRRFLNLLRKHDCHQPFQHFRTAKADGPSMAGADYIKRSAS